MFETIISLYFTIDVISNCVVRGSNVYPAQKEYLNTLSTFRHPVKCGMLPRKLAASGRIINGKVTDTVYPWMAKVINLEFRNGRLGEIYQSAGSIITDRIVLTCGHCICGNDGTTCHGGKTNEVDQNRENDNEV